MAHHAFARGLGDEPPATWTHVIGPGRDDDDLDRARPSRLARAIRAGIAILLMIGLVSLVLGLARPDRTELRGWVGIGPVERFAVGSVAHHARLGVFVVASERGVLAVIDRSPHLDEPVVYCRSSGWFESPAYGSKWDRYGIYRSGPAPRGLDRRPVRVSDGLVWVLADQIIPGPPRGTPGETRPAGPFCANPSQQA